MRIDLLITELEAGGAERFCVELAVYLTYRGHLVRVLVLGKKPSPHKERLWKRLSEANIPHEFFGCESAVQVWRALRRLKQSAKSDPPDLAQSILWHANIIAAVVYPRLSIPLVGGVRVADPRPMRFWLSRWAASRMEKIVCVSNSTKIWCTEIEKLPADKVVSIPNGIDVESIELCSKQPHDHCGLPLEAPVLLFVGRLHHQKGVDVLIERANRLLTELPDHHLVLIGDGPLRLRVDNFQRTSPSKSRIHVLGQRDDVPQWIKRCQLLILPTRYEGMPNVVLEAMALGRTVVTMRVEGIEEILGDLTKDQSVEPNNWDAWLARVVGLARDPDSVERIGKSNRERIVHNFLLNRQLEQYEALYRTLVR